MRQIPAWMGVIFEEKPDGKLNKPPCRIKGGRARKADKTNPKNHCTFAEAAAALEAGVVDAIGFVFTAGDPCTVVDLDGVLNDGELDADAADIVADFETYWEISCSSTGLHAVVLGEKPGTRCRKGNVEIYDGRSGARFMVMTGNVLGDRKTVRNCQGELDALYKRLFPEPKRKIDDRASISHDLEDTELLERARASRTGTKFCKLFDRGDTSSYESHSSADFALINTLIFWTGGDAERIERLFEQSALYRPRGKHRGYVARSVKSCLERYSGSYYQPRAVREQPEPKQEDILAPYLALLADPSQWKGQKEATAYKAYAALFLMAVEDGVATGKEQDVLRIGADVRRLAERCGANRVTLQRSTLPYLWKERKLIEWRPGKGRQAGEFILKKQKLTPEATNKGKHTTVYTFIGSTQSESLNALAQLIRMRSGVSRTGETRKPQDPETATRQDKIRELGKFETVSRLGPVAMFCLVVLIGSKRGLPLPEIAERTGRRKDNIRRVMRKLVDAGISEESHGDFFTLASDFWKAYKQSLIKTGIRRAEVRQKQAHDRERRDRDARLAGKPRKKISKKVIDMDARRREKGDREAKRRQFMEHQDEDTLTPQQMEEKLQEVLMDNYDHMVAECMERLGKRRKKEGAS